MRAVFLDRDGTIIAGIPKYERIDSIEKAELLPHVLEALTLLASLDFRVFLVTNQAGLAEGLITEAEFDTINNRVLEVIALTGVKIIKTYVCPHGEQSSCECRKPKPAMLQWAARDFDIDLSQSWMIGDRETDVQTGINAGTRTILVQTGAVTTTSKEATYTAPNLLDAIEYITRQGR